MSIDNSNADQNKIKNLLKIEKSSPSVLNQGKKLERTEWRLPNGKLHREFGPAVYSANRTEEWFKDGKRHRECGPAIEPLNGSKWYYKKGKLHREDGPAVIIPINEKKESIQYWVENTELTKEEFEQWKLKNKKN